MVVTSILRVYKASLSLILISRDGLLTDQVNAKRVGIFKRSKGNIFQIVLINLVLASE
jgi:hypothetical protein